MNEQEIHRQKMLNNDYQGYASRFKDSVNQHDHKFIEQWVQNYVLKDKDGETLCFDSQQVSQFSGVINLLKSFFQSSVVSISFKSNYIDDYVLQSQLLTHLSHFKELQRVVVSGNQIGTASLETLGFLFQKCPKIEELDISNNFIGGNTPQGDPEKQIVDNFLYKFFTELNEPKKLNLSSNQLTDDCLYPVVKYIFANYECKLTYFSLENNQFSVYSGRTLLKAYSISPSRSTLDFQFGSLPLSINNLKAAVISSQDQVSLDVLNITTSSNKIQNKENNYQKIELTISRKSNNFYGGALKAAPVFREAREKLNEYFNRIDSIVENSEDTEIEEIQEFVAEITSEQQFEIPRYRLEPIFNLITDKIDIAIDHENIYVLEILLDCLKYLNARYEKAEKKYYELANEAQQISLNLVKVLNMEFKDFNDMQRALVTNLKRGKEIGLRGQLIDAARNLYFRSDQELQELRNKASGVSDDEDDALYEVNDDERPLNVYDPILDKYIDMKHEDLGLTSDFEINLASHPYSTDYMRLTNLNLNYVVKNQSMARKNLLDEEAYGFRNIFERCTVLLNEIKGASENSLSYSLTRNDQSLKMARLIFRYKNNLDKLFEFKSDPFLPSLAYKNKHETFTDFLKLRYQMPQIKELQIVTWPSSSVKEPLKQSITKVTKCNEVDALKFNKAILEIINQDLKNHEARPQVIQQIQDLFEKFVIRVSTSSKKTTKQKKIKNQGLADEFYLQLFHQVSGQLMNSHQHQFYNSFLLMALLSNYYVPQSMAVHSGLYNEIITIKEQIFENESLLKIIIRLLNNFALKNDDSSDEFMGFSRKEETKKFESNLTGVYSWPPFQQEIESLINDQPIILTVYLMNGEKVSVKVDETSTVEEVFEDVMQNSSLREEPEYEMFSLFRSEIKPGTSTANINRDLDYELDYPIPKDKKIMKLLYNNYQTQKTLKLRIPDLEIQDLFLVIKRRVFHSLFVYNNFKALSKTSLDHCYGQQLNEYVNRNLLQNICSSEDVIYLGALIIRIKLKSKIPNLKKMEDYIQNNILEAIPNSFIDSKSNPWSSLPKNLNVPKPKRMSVGGLDAHHHGHMQTSVKARNAKHWIDQIMEQFKKQEFLELNVEDAKEKFLTQIGLYNIMFSQVYMVEKSDVDKRDNMRSNLLNQIAATRNINQVVVEENEESSDSGTSQNSSLNESSDQIQSSKKVKKKNKNTPQGLNLNVSMNQNSTINESSVTSQNDTSQNQSYSVEESKEKTEQDMVQKTLWQQFSGDHIMLIINIQGIQMLECSKRDKIIYHIDYEDIIYVMGKGNKLKLGFVYHQLLADQSTAIDCNTVLTCCDHIGLKARCIAEDIISYAQIRLTELTKNHQVEYALKNRTNKDSIVMFKKKKSEEDHLLYKSNQSIDRSSIKDDYDDGIENNDHVKAEDLVQKHLESISGIRELELRHEDLLESFDMDGDDDEKNFISGINYEQRQTIKAATASERYFKQVQSRLGSAIKFRLKPFFVYNRKCPYHSTTSLSDQTGESSHEEHDYDHAHDHNHDHAHAHSPNDHNHDHEHKEKENSGNLEPQPSSASPQKYWSGGQGKQYMNKQHTVIEEDDEESSLANNTENNTPSEKKRLSVEKERNSTVADGQPNLNDFMAQMAQMDSNRESSTSNFTSRNPSIGVNNVNTNSQGVKQQQSTSSAVNDEPLQAIEEIKQDQTDTKTELSANASSVDFTSLGNKEDRQKEAQNLFAAALSSAPPF